MVDSTSSIVQETVKISITQVWLHSHFLMYNEGTQFLLEIYRKYFGYVATRERLRGRKDAFFEFHINEDSQADQEVLKRLSSTIVKVSELCFKDCIETNYNIFTTDEKACIERCTNEYFEGYQKISEYTYRQLHDL